MKTLATIGLLVWPLGVMAQNQRAWFADGYHGGIYGHYPPAFTQFMVDGLGQHPDRKLNLEIEPETWDYVRTNTPSAYQAFGSLVASAWISQEWLFGNEAIFAGGKGIGETKVFRIMRLGD